MKAKITLKLPQDYNEFKFSGNYTRNNINN